MYKIGVMGDSKAAGTGAAPRGPLGCDELLKIQYPANYVKFATPATKIAYQLDLWNAQTEEEKQSFDYIFTEVGNNDFYWGTGASHLMPVIQGLIDQINADKKSTCEIICNIFTPVRGSWEDNYTEEQVQMCIVNWEEVYDAHKGNGAYAITGIDRMLDQHVAILCEDYYLRAQYYDGTDRLHYNLEGRDVISDIWRKYLLGFI